MKRFLHLLVCCAVFVRVVASLDAFAAEAPPAASAEAAKTATTDAEKIRATEAVAAKEMQARAEVKPPDFLEHLVDSILSLFDMEASGNTAAHYGIAGLLLVVSLLARRIVTRLLFPVLRRLAAKTETTFDDKLFPALEGPVAAFVMLVGIFAAFKVLKLTPAADFYISSGSRVAFTLVIFWGLWRLLAAALEHSNEIARSRSMGIAAFMPWIKKTLLTVFIVLGVLLTIQSLGYDVKAILAGLGIGGLAFALAAQDTLANVFGAIVVAIDQPFKIGETVRIGTNVGGVEDIGLRSTRIRLVDKSLMVIPNKTVAAETITNLSRFTRRRVEQVIGLTYDTKPEQMEDIVAEIRKIVTSQPEVDASSMHVYFRDLNASSLDIWVVYETPDPDFPKHMAVKRGLSFAFPTQTVHLAGEVAEQLVSRSEPAAPKK